EEDPEVTSVRRVLSAAGSCVAGAWASGALGAVVMPAPSAASPTSEPSTESATCQETFTAGSARPKVVESFPAKGRTGSALVLDVVVEHGKGETVLQSGMGSQAGAGGSRALEAAGFHLPSEKGSSRPSLETTVEGDRARTHLTIPVVALPKKPGRAELE